MRTGIALLLLASIAQAQVWEKATSPTKTPAPQQTPPQVLPTSIAPAPTKLPRDEKLQDIDLRSLRIQYLAQRLVITNNNQTFREFNPQTGDAEATLQLIKELMAVKWGVIGKSRVVIEYGLTTGVGGMLVVPRNAGFPQSVVTIDAKTLKVEQIRGAWCVRDDAGILLNFGVEREEAEQAVAIVHKYGFNRIGTAGKRTIPAVTYFFAATEATIGAKASLPDELQRIRDSALQRTGIEVPGTGFVGEKITFDPRKVEVRRETNTVTLRHGVDVLARFGRDEWIARDALKVIQDARVNEFCRVGGVTFFLKDGKAPTNVPFLARTSKFDAASLKAQEFKGKWCMTDVTAKPIVSGADEAEIQQLIRVVQALGFNATATVGNPPGGTMMFFAKMR